MMGSNVFGTTITEETLRSIPSYKWAAISSKDRAEVAMRMKNDGHKYVNVLQYVEKLLLLERELQGEDYGVVVPYSNSICTLGLVYNATGDSVTVETAHDWAGRVRQAPYPTVIANGQWGGFLHATKPDDRHYHNHDDHVYPEDGHCSGSRAAVVYRGKNDGKSVRDFMMCWCTTSGLNQVYTEVREEGHYNNNDVWEMVDGLLAKSGAVKSDRWGGCHSIVSTASGTCSIIEAVLTLA